MELPACRVDEEKEEWGVRVGQGVWWLGSEEKGSLICGK